MTRKGYPHTGIYRYGEPRSHVPLMKKLRRGVRKIKPSQLVYIVWTKEGA